MSTESNPLWVDWIIWQKVDIICFIEQTFAFSDDY